jgi:hypothetical protein
MPSAATRSQPALKSQHPGHSEQRRLTQAKKSAMMSASDVFKIGGNSKNFKSIAIKIKQIPYWRIKGFGKALQGFERRGIDASLHATDEAG